MNSGSRRVTPVLMIDIPFEGVARINLFAESEEDELRLRAFLRRSSALRALPTVLGRLLDDLDAVDREAA